MALEDVLVSDEDTVISVTDFRDGEKYLYGGKELYNAEVKIDSGYIWIKATPTRDTKTEDSPRIIRNELWIPEGAVKIEVTQYEK